MQTALPRIRGIRSKTHMKHRKAINHLVSILLHALLLIIVYIFQGAIFPFMRLGGLVPLLLPVVVAGVALYEGRDTGGICGLFAGILCDVSFNQPVGTFTLVLTMVGLLVGILSDAIILSGFVTYYITCAIVLVICAFVQITPHIAVPNDIPTSVILGRATAQTAYAMVLALPIWFAVRALGKRAERFLPSNQ